MVKTFLFLLEVYSPQEKVKILKIYSPMEILFSRIIFHYRTVSAISSDPLCKDDNVRFTTEPLKVLSDQL